MRRQVLDAYIEEEDEEAEQAEEEEEESNEFGMKKMLLSKYGLRADDDEPTLREIYDNMRVNFSRIEKRLDTRMERVEQVRPRGADFLVLKLPT